MNQQVFVAIYHLFYKFSCIFNILKKIKFVLKIKMQIMYKRKMQKTNSININILNELKFKMNLKWKKILKLFAIVNSLK